MEVVRTGGFCNIRSEFINQGYSNETVEILMKSWRTGTIKQYEPVIKLWFEFCYLQGKDPFKPPLPVALEFLAKCFEKGWSYDKIKNARSALSAVILNKDNMSFGKIPIVKRFMKGVFESRPQFRKAHFIWDVSIVLNYFRSLPDSENLPLSTSTKKLALLLSIITGGQRTQTLQSIDIENINILKDKVVIPITKLLKQSRPMNQVAPLVLKSYETDIKLCPVYNLNLYLKCTAERRQSKQLFVSYVKPYKAVSRDTISRWCKDMLQEAGINTDTFTAHSSRSAAASSSKMKGVPLVHILSNAGWSNERTFASHYDRVVIEDTNLLHALTS